MSLRQMLFVSVFIINHIYHLPDPTANNCIPSGCPPRPPAHPYPIFPLQREGNGDCGSGRIWGWRKWGQLVNMGEFAIFLFNCTYFPASYLSSFLLSTFFVPFLLSSTPSYASSLGLFSELTCASSSGFFCVILSALLCAFLYIGLNIFLHDLLPLGPA